MQGEAASEEEAAMVRKLMRKLGGSTATSGHKSGLAMSIGKAKPKRTTKKAKAKAKRTAAADALHRGCVCAALRSPEGEGVWG